MTELDDLYAYADEHGISVDYFMMSCAESLSEPIGAGAVAIDPFHIRSIADEKVKLAHELGHCETGSFYNRYSPFDLVARHENRADKWAVKKLVTKDELQRAVADGHMELWELSEHFDIPEPFMRKVINLYFTGSVAG